MVRFWGLRVFKLSGLTNFRTWGARMKGEEKMKWRTFEIGTLLGDWYGLLEMKHNQSLSSVGEIYFIRLTCQLFQGLRDYFTLSCGAEMRHAKSQAEFFLPSFPVSDSSSRGEAVQALLEYSPRSILEGAMKVFDPRQNSWESSYGGERWWAIATYTLSAFETSSLSDMIIKIDSFVYLVHNNGTALNKFEAGFTIEDNTQKFLTDRRESNSSVMEILYHYRLGSLRYWNLVFRSSHEPPFKETAKGTEREIQAFLDNEGIVPCQWGSKELDLELADSPHDLEFSEDSSEDDGEGHLDEEEQEESNEISVSSSSEGSRS